jgi:hypothetical protein
MGVRCVKIEVDLSGDDQHLALAECSHVTHEPPRAVAEADMLAR